MQRYNKILKNKDYIKALNLIEKNEENRIFCKHNLEHFLDVARISYILSLENNLNIPKDILYATSLLHDLGRAYSGKDHDVVGANLSTKILKESGYLCEEISLITSAILNHRQENNENSLSSILYKADKISRQCYKCKAQKDCYWEKEKRNEFIKY